MRKILLVFVVVLLTVSETFAYAMRVYDEYGNRIGTYRKDGDNYELYDFHDNKVTNPNELIQNAPDQQTLTQYSRTFYDENMMPIGTMRSGFYGNNGQYYPPGMQYYPSCWRRNPSPYIVRPRTVNNEGMYKYADYKDSVNYVDTRYPKFHKFKR